MRPTSSKWTSTICAAAMCFGQKAASVRSQLSASSSFGGQEQSTGMAALLGHQLPVDEILSAHSGTTWAPGQRQLDANPEALATYSEAEGVVLEGA